MVSGRILRREAQLEKPGPKSLGGCFGASNALQLYPPQQTAEFDTGPLSPICGLDSLEHVADWGHGGRKPEHGWVSLPQRNLHRLL